MSSQEVKPPKSDQHLVPLELHKRPELEQMAVEQAVEPPLEAVEYNRTHSPREQGVLQAPPTDRGEDPQLDLHQTGPQPEPTTVQPPREH